MDNTYRSQFRIPGELYEKLKISSADEGRSLNGEIVYRLMRSFDRPLPLKDASNDQLLKELVRRFGGSVQITLSHPADRSEGSEG